MINFNLAREIYGITPWMMDAHSIPVMTSILKDVKNGVKFEIPETKLNSTFVYDLKNQTKIIEKEYHLNTREDFEGIALIKLDGAITLSGGESTVGMEQISEMMYRMCSDSRIKAFMFLTNSGGGSSSAVELMVDTINEIKQTMPVYALVKKGGMACSAAYGIISACTMIYSESEMNIVGSIGTMIQFEGKVANSVDPDGTKNIRLYATKSTKKNEGFEQALNNDNYSLLIDDMLDPINENFIDMILANRPKIDSKAFDDGRTYFSKDVVGSFIDGIASFSEVIDIIVNSKDFNTPPTPKEFNTNINNQTMTEAEFKIANPEAYNKIFADGVAQTYDVVGAWLAHVETDPKAVAEGINSKQKISETKREELLVKQNSKVKLKSMVDDSAEDINTDESTTSEEEINKKKKAAEVSEAFKFELK